MLNLAMQMGIIFPDVSLILRKDRENLVKPYLEQYFGKQGLRFLGICLKLGLRFLEFGTTNRYGGCQLPETSWCSILSPADLSGLWCGFMNSMVQ